MKRNESSRLITSSVSYSDLLSSNISPVSPAKKANKLDSWGATPGLRQQWFNSKDASMSNRDFFALLVDVNDVVEKKSIADDAVTIDISPDVELHDDPQHKSLRCQSMYHWFRGGVDATPGVLIAIILNLFLSTSFGLAFFPSDFQFPAQVPRAIGVQMFLFATFISQIVLTRDSHFSAPIGMMMVENIPFMHAICDLVSKSQAEGYDVMATVLFTYALSSIVVGIFFYILGKFKLGNAVYFFPKHVIVGCIGGIGIFIFQTGIEAATAKTWEWSLERIMYFLFDSQVAQYWLVSLAFELSLRVLSRTVLSGPLLPPFFFISIPPVFYLALFLFGVPVSSARAHGWFFEAADDANPLLMWELMNITKVNWTAVATAIPTILALTLFSLMHVPINIPSLSLSVKERVDMNNELKAHGISNILSGMLGGLQNYLCYSNSLLYFKCNGHGKVSGYFVAALIAIFFIIGPSMVQHVPRCMAGCLLMHVGIDLSKEALWDSRRGLDSFEYFSVVLITLVMTFYGMTAGLVFGVICAAITFTLQVSNHLTPIRGMMRATTLRSSKWRSIESTKLLDELSRHILVVQLQGQLFFGNATTFASDIEDILQDNHGSQDIRLLILDFTLVLSIDSSAAETISNIYELCKKYDVKLCYSRPSVEGFPCAVELSERLHEIASQSNHNRMNKISSSEHVTTSPSKSVIYSAVLDEGLDAYLSSSPVQPHLNRTLSMSSKSRRSSSSQPSNASVMRNNGFVVGIASDELPTISGYQAISSIDGTSATRQQSTAPSSPSTSSAVGNEGMTTHRNDTLRQHFLAEQMSIADSLDGALIWCEDQLLTSAIASYDYTDPFKNSSSLKQRPAYMKQLHAICPADIPSSSLDQLFSYFQQQHVSQGEVLWRQGDESDRALVLASGRLIHSLEEEAGTLELIEIGHLVGEYGMLSCQRRHGTLTAVQPSVIYVLSKERYEKMTAEEPFLSLVLARVCLGYLGHRVHHVSNRIWESRCVPV